MKSDMGLWHRVKSGLLSPRKAMTMGKSELPGFERTQTYRRIKRAVDLGPDFVPPGEKIKDSNR